MSNNILCTHCHKRIEFERPLFCPFCGGKIEPIDDLITGDESDIYPWSNVAPLLMRVFFYWLISVTVLTIIFGKKAFVVVSILFIFALISIFLLSLLKPQGE